MMSVFTHGHALLIGVGADLPMTAKDARDLEAALTREDLCAYPRAQVRRLTDGSANRAAVLEALDRLAERTGEDPEATVIVYFSGHGIGGTTPRLVTHGYDADRLDETTIRGTEFAQKLRAIQTQKLVVILDCCHAAGNADATLGERAKAPIPVAAIEELTRGEGRVVLASSRADEYSYSHGENSYFTEALLEALTGHGASRPDGFTRVLDTALYVGRVVPVRRSGYQHPVLEVWNLSDNFSIAYYAGGDPQPKNLRPIERSVKGGLAGQVQSDLSLQLAQLEKAEAEHDYLQKRFEDTGSEELGQDLERSRRNVLELRGQLGQIRERGPLGRSLTSLWSVLAVLTFYFSYNFWARAQSWPRLLWFGFEDLAKQKPILALYGMLCGIPLLFALLGLTRLYQQLDAADGFVSPLPVAFNLPLFSSEQILQPYLKITFFLFVALPLLFWQHYFLINFLEGQVVQRDDHSKFLIEKPLEHFWRLPAEGEPPIWKDDAYRIHPDADGGKTYLPLVSPWGFLLLQIFLWYRFIQICKNLSFEIRDLRGPPVAAI